MRRLSLTVGLITLLLPVAVHAEALSPWLQEVLDRIDAGMSTADARPAGTCNPDKDNGYLAEAEASIREFIDVRRQISRYQSYTKENTICFQSDVDLLEDKINELRTTIVDDAEACKLESMRILIEVLNFAVKAYDLLMLGGNDPSIQSDILQYEYFWESEALLESGSGSGITDTHSDAAQCPYTTDYSPHAVGYVIADGGSIVVDSSDIKSYGCDASVLENMPDQTQEMIDMLRFLNGDGGDNEGTIEFAKNMTTSLEQFLTNLDAIIADLRGTTPTSSFPAVMDPPPDHEERTGCLRPQVPLVALNPGDNAPDSMLDDYPDYYSEDNMREVEIAPGVFFQTFNPAPEEALPVGAHLRPAYDYFSIFSNPILMHRRFTAKKNSLGNNRPLPVRAQGGEGIEQSMFLLIYGADAPAQYRSISASVDRQTGFLEAASRDAIERTMQAYAPLQTAITTLSEVTEKELPEYIQDFGYFMLRQCVNGHCSEVDGTLDNMQKRIFNPACHPYVSGAYTDTRTHIKCLCIPKSAEEPDGLDVDACDCGGTPQDGDCKPWCAYCQQDPSQEERDKWADMEPELYPGCRVEQGDPESGY